MKIADSGSAVDLSPPPTHTDEQETPVVNELRWFALKSVADKLESPPYEEES